MNRFTSETAGQMTEEEKATVASLLKYPSLEKVFDRTQPHNLAETKQKMRATVAELERVIRSGTKPDAEKAAQIAVAYQTAINFLGELELIRKNQS